MENTKKISLAEFMTEIKPDTHGLNRFRDDIVILYNSGYSLKQIHEYVSLNGYEASYSPFTRWIKRHIDLASESNKAETFATAKIESEHKDLIFTKPSNTSASNTAAEQMKASMDRLLGGKTFDDQFAALKKDKHS